MAEPLLTKYLEPAVVAKLSNLNIIARLVVEGFITGLHKSPYRGFSIEFAEHRQYAPGDDLRHIDWKVFGKTDKFFIKQYDQETNMRAYILLDTSNSMAYSTSGVSKFDYAKFLSASLSFLMIGQQDSVGTITFSDKIMKYTPPKSSKGHLKIILEQIDSANTRKATDISSVLHDVAGMIKKRGLIIIVSDFLDNVDEVLKGIKHLRHKKHDIILFHVLDRSETDFPFETSSVFEDIETGRKLHINPKYIKKAYLDEIANFVSKMKRTCAEDKIDYCLLDTSTKFDVPLTSYLAKRIKYK